MWYSLLYSCWFIHTVHSCSTCTVLSFYFFVCTRITSPKERRLTTVKRSNSRLLLVVVCPLVVPRPLPAIIFLPFVRLPATLAVRCECEIRPWTPIGQCFSMPIFPLRAKNSTTNQLGPNRSQRCCTVRVSSRYRKTPTKQRRMKWWQPATLNTAPYQSQSKCYCWWNQEQWPFL